MSETTAYTDFRLHANRLAETGERGQAEAAVRRDLAAAYQLCALFGWDDLVYTHLSARVPGREHHFLVNPLGLGFDEITASSLIKIDLDGNVIGDSGGYEPNAAGFVIHGAPPPATRRPTPHKQESGLPVHAGVPTSEGAMLLAVGPRAAYSRAVPSSRTPCFPPSPRSVILF
jgi:hypothetical protein